MTIDFNHKHPKTNKVVSPGFGAKSTKAAESEEVDQTKSKSLKHFRSFRPKFVKVVEAKENFANALNRG